MICLFVCCGLFATAASYDQPSAAFLKRRIFLTPPDSTRAGLFLQLAIDYILRPGAEIPCMDSALFFIKQAEMLNGSLKNKAITAQATFAYACLYRVKGDTAAGHRAILRSLELLNAIPGHANEKGEAYVEAINYLQIGNPDDLRYKLQLYELAAAQFELSGNKRRQADVLKEIGDFSQFISDYGTALISLKKALVLYQSVHYKPLQGVYDLLGTVSAALGSYPDAVKYGLQAVKTAEEVQDTSLQLCTIYNRLAGAYAVWGESDRAISCLKKSLAIAEKYHDETSSMIVLLNLCYFTSTSNWRQNLAVVKEFNKNFPVREVKDDIRLYMCYDLVYVGGEQYDIASYYADSMIACMGRLSDIENLRMVVAPCLMQQFFMTGRLSEAAKYAYAYLVHSRNVNDLTDECLAYQFVAKIDSAKGNYKSAYDNYRTYSRLRDSMWSATASFQWAQIQTVYETEKKDRELQLHKKNIELLTDEAQLQEARLKKTGQDRMIIICSSLMLLGIIFTGYEFKKRRNTQLLTQQQVINERNHQLKALVGIQQKLVTEKEWLMKEVHHRVKNNLQIVISLLNAQSEFLDSPSAQDAIRESRERMQTIALIHQKLYQTEDTTVINMSSYIRELVAFLSSSFTDSWKIRFDIELEDISLDVSQAVPVGLILNEAITNAIKYAFPGDRSGIVNISLKRTAAGALQLKIKDNGRGFEKEIDTCNPDSLGIQLVKLFSDQLEGKLEISGINGVEISVEFKEYGEQKTKDNIILAA
ncbi:histidine kinase dimerization/phosphoacceptor domain -containing protein [Chitinophagaceae bacterium MMS25-I14]